MTDGQSNLGQTHGGSKLEIPSSRRRGAEGMAIYLGYYRAKGGAGRGESGSRGNTFAYCALARRIVASIPKRNRLQGNEPDSDSSRKCRKDLRPHHQAEESRWRGDELHVSK